MKKLISFSFFYLLILLVTQAQSAELSLPEDSIFSNSKNGDSLSIFTQPDTTSLIPTLNRRQVARQLGIKFIHPYRFFENSKEFNRARVITASTGIGAMYAGTSIWWSAAWYSKYDRGKFKFFNDWGEWLQMDKASHAFDAYFLSKWGHNIYRWAGVDKKHAPWIGMLAGNIWQLSIEINDGFSSEWGFSWPDIAANMTGSAIFGIQQYLWGEQRFNVKISAFPIRYSDDIKSRTDALYGTTFSEMILKDYNAITIWLSASPGSFIKKPDSKFPKWLAFSFGYGAKGMLGGYDNTWCENYNSPTGDCPPENTVDRSDIPRLRRYYLSADIDFTKIKTNKPALKTFLELINIIKIPFPALEIRSNGDVRWDWIKF